MWSRLLLLPFTNFAPISRPVGFNIFTIPPVPTGFTIVPFTNFQYRNPCHSTRPILPTQPSHVGNTCLATQTTRSGKPSRRDILPTPVSLANVLALSPPFRCSYPIQSKSTLIFLLWPGVSIFAPVVLNFTFSPVSYQFYLSILSDSEI